MSMRKILNQTNITVGPLFIPKKAHITSTTSQLIRNVENDA